MADVLKPEEELAIKANSSSQKCTIKDTKNISYATLPILEIPAIDIGILNSCSPSSEVEAELKKLRVALSSSGYIQVVNHGMSTSFLDEVHEVARNFFELPLEEKKKYSKSAYDFEGFGNNAVYKENPTLGWNDRLYLHVLPESIRKFEKWPQNPEKLRRILIEFTEKLRGMNEIIVKSMAKSLDLEENCFLHQFGENLRALSSFNFYPPCPWPDLYLAAKPHSDASATTFLLQDKEVEGLQVLKDDQWNRVPLTPDAILFNIGDQVQIMTNGIFKSSIHRVAINNKRERRTFALFFAPDPTSEIKPAKGLVDDKNLRLYKNVIDYGRHFQDQTQQGRTPIDALKV